MNVEPHVELWNNKCLVVSCRKAYSCYVIEMGKKQERKGPREPERSEM